MKNFYSLRDEVALDFTADSRGKGNGTHLPQNLIEFGGDKFVNIIGLFGSNAAGKSNLIKAVDFCRQFILYSDLANDEKRPKHETFKFGEDQESEFYIDFVTGGIEYEYSFILSNGKVLSEELYHYANKRKSRVFVRRDANSYSFGKGVQRPREISESTGTTTLFLTRAFSMNREFARPAYEFFLNDIVIGLESVNIHNLRPEDFDRNKSMLLKGLEVGDSDIVDIRLIEITPGQQQLQSFHRENPSIAFDFYKEESEGTKRLLNILILLLTKALQGTAFFIDEFDLKLHLRLAEFILDIIRASKKSQMVFTSHNPLLMNKENLRKEQIVIVNKQMDGNSEFMPLCDFVDLDKKADYMKDYILGRFDGVPYIGNARDIIKHIDNLR
ncbi:MAG: ATP-binding protein [Clostridium sp.]|nr:ATP-binding protein [Clostridium sp.]